MDKSKGGSGPARGQGDGSSFDDSSSQNTPPAKPSDSAAESLMKQANTRYTPGQPKETGFQDVKGADE